MVKECGISLSIFRMFLENQDKIKTKTAKESEIGNRQEEKNMPTFSKLTAWVVLWEQS